MKIKTFTSEAKFPHHLENVLDKRTNKTEEVVVSVKSNYEWIGVTNLPTQVVTVLSEALGLEEADLKKDQTLASVSLAFFNKALMARTRDAIYSGKSEALKPVDWPKMIDQHATNLFKAYAQGKKPRSMEECLEIARDTFQPARAAAALEG